MDTTRILFIQPLSHGWRIAFLKDGEVTEISVKALSVFEGQDCLHMGYFVGDGSFATNVNMAILDAGGDMHGHYALLAPGEHVGRAELEKLYEEYNRECLNPKVTYKARA